MTHHQRYRTILDEGVGYAAEQEFAGAAVAVGAHDDDSRIDALRKAYERFVDRIARFESFKLGMDSVAREILQKDR